MCPKLKTDCAEMVEMGGGGSWLKGGFQVQLEPLEAEFKNLRRDSSLLVPLKINIIVSRFEPSRRPINLFLMFRDLSRRSIGTGF